MSQDVKEKNTITPEAAIQMNQEFLKFFKKQLYEKGVSYTQTLTSFTKCEFISNPHYRLIVLLHSYLTINSHEGDFSCYPTQDRLAFDLGCSDTNVKELIKRLVEFSVIFPTKKGRGNRNAYAFNVKAFKFFEEYLSFKNKLFKKYENQKFVDEKKAKVFFNGVIRVVSQEAANNIYTLCGAQRFLKILEYLYERGELTEEILKRKLVENADELYQRSESGKKEEEKKKAKKERHRQNKNAKKEEPLVPISDSLNDTSKIIVTQDSPNEEMSVIDKYLSEVF